MKEYIQENINNMPHATELFLCENLFVVILSNLITWQIKTTIIIIQSYTSGIIKDNPRLLLLCVLSTEAFVL